MEGILGQGRLLDIMLTLRQPAVGSNCRCPQNQQKHRQAIRTPAHGTAEDRELATALAEPCRRSVFSGAAILIAAACSHAPAHAAGQSAEVGGYLPKAGIDDLVEFVPGTCWSRCWLAQSDLQLQSDRQTLAGWAADPAFVSCADGKKTPVSRAWWHKVPAAVSLQATSTISQSPAHVQPGIYHMMSMLMGSSAFYVMFYSPQEAESTSMFTHQRLSMA